MRQYMPVGHRKFVKDVERYSNVRNRVNAGEAALVAAYNAVLEGINVFRKIHSRLVHDYIMVPSGMSENEKGTGGTDAVDFLNKVRMDTVRMKIESQD